MLHVSETWPLKRSELPRIWRNDSHDYTDMQYKARGCGYCQIKTMLAQPEIDYVAVILREKRIRWFVHVGQFSGAIKILCDMQIVGEQGQGGPRHG